MADIGEEVEVQTTTEVDEVAYDPLTMTLTAIAPDGTTSTPTVNNPAVGSYVAYKVVDQAGRWLWKWTSTGPDGVDWDFTDVGYDPPAGPLPLATIGDLERRIGALTPAQAARAPALLEDASDLVRAECKQGFTRVVDDSIVLRVSGPVIALPKRPVVSVASVAMVGESQDLPLVEGAAWTFDGIDKVILLAGAAWVVNGPESWAYDAAGEAAYRVVYTHGDLVVPPVIRGLVANMVNRTLTAPAISDMVSQSIGQGDYAWQAQQSSGAMGAAVRLTAGDRAKLESWGYLRSYGQTETRLR
jgi:hypothetical protein